MNYRNFITQQQLIQKSMFKRPDSDIFGTKQLDQGIKIKNESFVDPHEAFKKKNDQNYVKYINKLGNVGRKNIDGNPQMTKVNEKAAFNEEYHKDKKFMDLQSTVFGEDKITRPKTSHQPTNALREKRTAINDVSHEVSYGRKNTLKRQVQSLPYNHSNLKGNSSQLFDFDEKVQKGTPVKDQPVLIPHLMQWDQHDSIRNNHRKPVNQVNPLICGSNVFEKAEETHSVEDSAQKNDRKQTLAQLKNLQKKPNPAKGQIPTKTSNEQKAPKQKQEPLKKQKALSGPTGDVEVRVVKGWDNKWMQGLSKYCKLYSTPMTKFELQGAGKAVIYLKRTKKWEAVTDWMAKDAKLKIRVTGN